MIALLAWLAVSFHLPWPAWAGIVVVAALLAYEHSLVSPNDLSRMNAAFFTVNGYISLLFLLFWGAAQWRSVAQRLIADFRSETAGTARRLQTRRPKSLVLRKAMSELQINDARLKPIADKVLPANA